MGLVTLSSEEGPRGLAQGSEDGYRPAGADTSWVMTKAGSASVGRSAAWIQLLLLEGTTAAEVKYLDSRSVVLNQSQFCALGDTWQYPKILLIVTIGGLPLEFSIQRIGMLLNILQCIRNTPVLDKELPSPKCQ